MTRQNLTYNPSIRLGLDGYTPVNGATLSVQSGRGFYGADYLQVAKSASSASGVQLRTISLPSTNVLPYSFSAYVQVPITNPSTEPASLAIRVVWQDVNGQKISEDSSEISVVTPSSSDWTRLTGVASSPAGAVYALISVTQLISGTAGAVFYLDAVLFEQSSFVGGYLDNINEELKQHIVNTALTPFSQPIPQGIQLNADVIFNDLVLNTIDEDNIIWICTDIDGWWNPAEAESPDIERGAEDGSYDVSGRYKARVLNLSGAFLVDDPSKIGIARDKLIAAINVVRRGAWLRTNEEPTKAAYVRLSGRPVIQTVNARGRTEFEIGLKASDPIKYHWNDSDLGGFTTVAPVADPEARQTNLATNPSFETAFGTVTVRTNYALDPGARNSPVTWTTRGGTPTNADVTTSRQAVSWSVSGFAYRVAGSATSTYLNVEAGPGYQTGTGFPVSAGQVVSASFRCAASDSRKVHIRFRFTAGGSIDIAGADQTIDTTSQLVTASVTAPAGSTSVVASILAGDTLPFVAGQWFDSSDAVVEVSPISGPYFDGSTSPAGDFTYSWTGTANASTSIQTGLGVAGISGAVQSTDWHASGSKSARVIPQLIGFTNDTYLQLGSGAGMLSGMVAGKTYTVSATIRLSAPQTGGGLRPNRARAIAFFVNGGAIEADSPQAPNAAGVTRLSVVLAIPADATNAFIRLYNGDVVGDVDVWWDDLAIVEGVYTGDYFDGSTTDSPEYLYSWTGTPNASTSERFLGQTIDVNAENIGTSAVTALFDITGPMGIGSYIYNRNTDETLTLTKELRGTGTLATLVTKQLFNNVATITTSAPHKLLVGDKILVQGPGAPFDSVHEELEVTQVGLIPPYSFSYARVFLDIDEVPTTGTVALAHSDVLSVDTYNKSVIFNGSDLGNRSRIDTLADWIKLAPGDNLLGFTDNPVHRKVINKDLKSNKITLTTDQSHMFLPGETLSVDLATEATLARKSLTNNRITLTTTEPHGFSVGDTIAVVSTETSTITQKQVTSNVATLTTAVAGGFSVGDIIDVTLPTTGTIATKAVASNVATVTSTAPHGFGAGDSVTVSLATSADPLQKSLTNNVATIITKAAHGFSVGDTVNVALNTGTSIVNKFVNGSQVNLTTSTVHGFSVGDQVTIQLPVTAIPTGTRQMAGNISYLATINTVTAHNFSVGDRIQIDLKIPATQTVTNRSATTSACTLTTATHNFSVGETIVVSGVSTRYNGTFTITAVTATTFTYANAGTAESSTASGGSVTNRSIQGYSGPAYIDTIPTATSFSFHFYGQEIPTSSTLYGANPAITNLSNQKLNGSFLLTSVASNQLTYSI